jgi:hypothetical protein
VAGEEVLDGAGEGGGIGSGGGGGGRGGGHLLRWSAPAAARGKRKAYQPIRFRNSTI